MILDTNAVSALLTGDSALGELLAREERHHVPVTATSTMFLAFAEWLGERRAPGLPYPR